MKRILLLAAFFCVTCFSQAEYDFNFKFSGQINEITENENEALPGISLNQQFNGVMSYSIVPDQSANEEGGAYNQNASISVKLGPETYTYRDKHVYIRSGINSRYYGDYFNFAVDASVDEYLNVTWFGIELNDFTCTALSDDSLPVSFDLTKFDSALFKMIGTRKDPSTDHFNRFIVTGTLNEITPVPEPSMLLLFGLGGILLRKK